MKRRLWQNLWDYSNVARTDFERTPATRLSNTNPTRNEHCINLYCEEFKRDGEFKAQDLFPNQMRRILPPVLGETEEMLKPFFQRSSAERIFLSSKFQRVLSRHGHRLGQRCYELVFKPHQKLFCQLFSRRREAKIVGGTHTYMMDRSIKREQFLPVLANASTNRWHVPIPGVAKMVPAR